MFSKSFIVITSFFCFCIYIIYYFFIFVNRQNKQISGKTWIKSLCKMSIDKKREMWYNKEFGAPRVLARRLFSQKFFVHFPQKFSTILCKLHNRQNKQNCWKLLWKMHKRQNVQKMPRPFGGFGILHKILFIFWLVKISHFWYLCEIF